jgi:hypothetical protein
VRIPKKEINCAVAEAASPTYFRSGFLLRIRRGHVIIAKMGIICILAFLTGCAAKVTSIRETYHDVTLKLDAAGNSRYSLYSSTGQRLGTAAAPSGTLRFSLPSQLSAQECLSVKNERGEMMQVGSQGNTGFRVQLPEQHAALQFSYSREERKHDELTKALSQHRSSSKQVSSQLSVNRAHRAGTCSLPAQRSLPAQPVTRCTSRDTCFADATQICFAMAFGAEGCSMALSSQNVPGIISGPSCGAAAAKLAGEKYGMGSAIVDGIIGIVDDNADSLMQSESVADNVWGVVTRIGTSAVKYAQANSCRSDFMEKHYSPYESWLQQVAAIEREPGEALQECRQFVARQENEAESVGLLQAQRAASRETLQELSEQLTRIEGQVLTTEIGCGR